MLMYFLKSRTTPLALAPLHVDDKNSQRFGWSRGEHAKRNYARRVLYYIRLPNINRNVDARKT